MFRDTESYRQSNSDAHRVRSTNITPPAMIWHMAFWIPKIVDNDIEDAFFKRSTNRIKIQNKLDDIFIEIAKQLRMTNKDNSIIIHPFVGRTAILFNKYVNLDSLSVVDSFRPTDIMENIKNSDHRTIIIEFGWENYWITIRCGLQTEYFTVIVIVEAARGTDDTIKKEGAIEFFARALDGYKPNNMDLNELYNKFWEEFSKFIYSLDGLKTLMDPKLFDQVYADSRGLITYDDSLVADNYCTETQWAHEAIALYRRKLTNNDSYECTASFVLNKRAVFMTALGPQLPGRMPESRNPITFVLCLRSNLPPDTVPINKWQLGRLIDRISFLGRVRLAALKNIKILRLVSVELGRIDLIISNARMALESYNSDEQLTQSNRAIEEAHRHLNLISNTFLQHPENKSRSGILYRVERSRYYVMLFRKNVKKLRLSRVEGYQRYDDFVEKRLGSTFDSIDRIGIRYVRALRTMAAIDQNYLAVRSHKTGEDVKNIQYWGELFLISVLVPYYLIGIFSHLVEFTNEYKSPMIFIGIVILVCTSGYGLAKFYKMKGGSQNSLRIVAVIASLMAIFIALSTVQQKKERANETSSTGYSH